MGDKEAILDHLTARIIGLHLHILSEGVREAAVVAHEIA
jgi:hypothetical protein